MRPDFLRGRRLSRDGTALPDSSRFQKPDEHIRLVKEIFSSIPKRYDLINHLLSFGQDIRWRRFTIGKMRFQTTHRLLDLAAGTADLAIGAVRRYPAIEAVGVDFSLEMLRLAQAKINRLGLGQRLTMSQGDALNLPFPDAVFDVAAIAFGIRNIPDRQRALREMVRVVRPGGQVLVLEMGYPRTQPGKMLFRPYLTLLLPLVGRLLAQNPAAYRYLADSIMRFPGPDDFARIMSAAGLTRVAFYPLTMGITCLYEGIRPLEFLSPPA